MNGRPVTIEDLWGPTYPNRAPPEAEGGGPTPYQNVEFGAKKFIKP